VNEYLRFGMVLLGVSLLTLLVSLPGWLYLKNRGQEVLGYEYGSIVYSICLWLYLMYVHFGQATLANIVEVIVLVPAINIVTAYIGVVVRCYQFGQRHRQMIAVAIVLTNLLAVFAIRLYMPALPE